MSAQLQSLLADGWPEAGATRHRLQAESWQDPQAMQRAAQLTTGKAMAGRMGVRTQEQLNRARKAPPGPARLLWLCCCCSAA
eukprot:15465183-Alexandrium_andersonii.AAC.1